jgi:hypothetical protein
LLPNNTVPKSMNMEFDWLTFNGKAGPALTPLIIPGSQKQIEIVAAESRACFGGQHDSVDNWAVAPLNQQAILIRVLAFLTTYVS